MNNLEDSISLVEKTAKKLLPIFKELSKRAVGFKPTQDSLEVDGMDEHFQKKSNISEKLIDMRHMLGFLNQSEWVCSLNIGNIMQINPIQREDLIMHKRNE